MYNTKIVLISGKLQSGKNQFAEYLKTELEQQGHKVRCDLFAKGVKDGVRKDFAQLFEYLNSLNVPELKTTKENFYENKTKLTRIMLQLYGTNVFRDHVDADYWVKQLVDRARTKPGYITLVTDVRFPNEIEVLQLQHNIDSWAIRIDRKMDRNGTHNEHISETALDDYGCWEHRVDNNGTLENLKVKVKLFADKLTNEINVYG